MVRCEMALVSNVVKNIVLLKKKERLGVARLHRNFSLVSKSFYWKHYLADEAFQREVKKSAILKVVVARWVWNRFHVHLFHIAPNGLPFRECNSLPCGITYYPLECECKGPIWQTCFYYKSFQKKYNLRPNNFLRYTRTETAKSFHNICGEYGILPMKKLRLKSEYICSPENVKKYIICDEIKYGGDMTVFVGKKRHTFKNDVRGTTMLNETILTNLQRKADFVYLK